MKITRRGGTVRLRLAAAESQTLDAVFEDLESALAGLGPGDEVWDRLHPAAYDDAEAASEFRDLVDDDVDAQRVERIGMCRAELAQSGGDLRLAEESLDRWLVTVNDIRLAIGTRIGVTADDDPVDPAFAEDHGRLLYGWLTWLQDALVTTAMGD
ncbi:MAG: DUF2017 family protein [Jatrophihabitans sp.]